MKKAIALLATLFILLCVSAEAEIFIDFSQQTNGVWGEWQYIEDKDGHHIVFRLGGVWGEWQHIKDKNSIDQIYASDFANVLNCDSQILVPPTEDPWLKEGWTEDGTTYVSFFGKTKFYVSGLQADTTYYVFGFVPREDGTTSFFTTNIEVQQGEDMVEIGLPDLGPYPGVYENVTFAIASANEIYTHTFNVQVQNVSEFMSRELRSGRIRGLAFDYPEDNWYDLYYLRKGKPIDKQKFTKSSKGLSIVCPLENDVIAGVKTGQQLGGEINEIYITLDKKPDSDIWYDAVFSLTEVATGQEKYRYNAPAMLCDNGKTSYFYTPVAFPEQENEGEYLLSIEIYYLDVDNNFERISLGTDTVKIYLEYDYSFEELFDQYYHSDIDYADAIDRLWSGDY